jgi:hypothetical protein
MQSFERTNAIHIGIWTRSSGSTRIFGTQSTCSIDYKHDRTRQNTELDESTYDHGEYRILARFHQEVQKVRDKAWHDIHIKRKKFKGGDLVLMYHSKSFQHPGKLRMHWLGPYKVITFTNGKDVQLKDLGVIELIGMINGNHLKLYRDN